MLALRANEGMRLRARSVSVLQVRPARAVKIRNTVGGALEDDWVDVGQIGAATAITGLR